MAKYYGDIPCVNIDGLVHITINATSCLCGRGYVYGKPVRRDDSQSFNIIWREIDAVSCAECRRLFFIDRKGKDKYV